MENSKYLKEVREQYENYPYPRRVPEDEKTRIWRPVFDSLDLINYYCFEGKKDFGKGFRVLVAGGGTGDATTYLAEQLKDTCAEITHLDMSSASIEIAKKRAEIRGLKNITFIHDSILEIPNLGLGKFDYINCSGVLHHLASPDDGLAALASVLHDDGAMGIMVYGKYGRTPTYFMQSLMRMVNKGEENVQIKIDNTKTMLKHLPPTNWVKRDEETYRDELEQSGDVGIYDLFVHTQDRAYSVPESYEWVRGAGLKILTFLDQFGLEKLIYSPGYYVKDPELLEKISALPKEEQEAIAELINGSLRKNSFYIAKNERKIPSIEDEDNVPFFSSFFYTNGIYDEIKTAFSNRNLNVLTINKNMVNMQFARKKYTGLIFNYLDGNRTIGEIIAAVKTASRNSEIAEIKTEFAELYDSFNMFDWLLLRHKSCPNVVKSDRDLQRKFLGDAEREG